MKITLNLTRGEIKHIKDLLYEDTVSPRPLNGHTSRRIHVLVQEAEAQARKEQPT